MADKPPPPDQNILVYVPDYQNAPLQTTLNSRKSFYYRGYESPRSDSVRSETAESTCSSLSSTDTFVDNEHSDFKQQESIAPPYGWKRLHTNGIVIYVSPSNNALSSTEQIKAYLQTEGTCKCGLECPLDCDATFNFDPKVLTRAWTAPVIGPGELTKLCNHKRKLLASLSSVDNVDNRYDGVRRKKRKVTGHGSQPSVSQLLAQRDHDRPFKDQQSYTTLPWRENVSNQFVRGVYSNGYQDGGQFRYQECSGGVQFQRTVESSRYPTHNPGHPAQNSVQQQHITQTQSHFQPPQVQFENRLPYPQQNIEPKYTKPPLVRLDYSQPQEVQTNITNTVQSTTQSLNVNRTPPWHQSRLQQANIFERVPPLHHHNPPVPVWNTEIKKKQNKVIRNKQRFSEDCPNVDARTLTESPSFMDDPSGYLAQQTALLNSTISRQNANSPCIQEGVPIASNINKFNSRSKCKNFITRFPDSSGERKKAEEPSSTLVERIPDDRGPIQGGTVSTSNRSPVEARPADSRNIVTTMASGHTASSNTITSVLAGRANTVTVSVNNQTAPQKPQLDMVQNVISNIQPEVVKPGHILVSSNGQLIVTNSMLAQQQNVQKISPTSSAVGQIGVTSQVLNQPTVLVNTLPGPLLLQPSVMVDGLNTVQIPQIVGNVVQNQVLEENNLLSPDSKRKASMKKRKLSPTVGSMLLSPQNANNVMVPQQQINTPMLQALTILPAKANFAGTQQLITTNMLQPLNLVQNFPIQQFIVPAGVSSMVMSDGTILQDTVPLNLLTPVQNTAVFSNGQNLIAPGMVIRTPNNQNANKVIQNNQFLSSPNQFLVNNTFGSQLSPMLSVSPNQNNRNQEFLPQNVVVQQPNTTNTTVVQQNTTIVQQTTMVSNQQTQPTPTLNLNQNFILNDKPNFILTSEKQNFILSPNNDKIIINSDNIRGNFVLGNLDKQSFVINNMEKPNLIINNFDKTFLGNVMDKKNSVSTQTQNQQVLQISSSPALVVATNNALCHTSTYTGSPPDTTTLSPVDQEVSTSLQPNSPDPGSQSLPMVHCVSSSNQQEDGYQMDTYNGNMGKTVAYVESSCIPMQPIQDKNISQDEYSSKISLCTTPDSGNINDKQESDGVVN